VPGCQLHRQLREWAGSSRFLLIRRRHLISAAMSDARPTLSGPDRASVQGCTGFSPKEAPVERPEQKKTAHDLSDVFNPSNASPSSEALINQQDRRASKPNSNIAIGAASNRVRRQSGLLLFTALGSSKRLVPRGWRGARDGSPRRIRVPAGESRSAAGGRLQGWEQRLKRK
jgi:hypothetical protein